MLTRPVAVFINNPGISVTVIHNFEIHRARGYGVELEERVARVYQWDRMVEPLRR